MKKILLAIAVGGFIGALARYAMTVLLGPIITSPFSIWVINMIGCFLLLFFNYRKINLPRWLRVGISTGIIGAFTTFSTFIVDIILYWHDGKWFLGLFYLLITIVGAGIASYVGYLLASKLNNKQNEVQQGL